MNQIIIEEKIRIENMIYEIRGVQVMLDSDLAKLYNVETKRINEAVKNNPLKFPERFSWILTDEESDSFLAEIFDQKIETRGGRYRNPRVFTEQGVAMLATILKTKAAVEVSIRIMDAFVSMRHFLLENKDIYKSIVAINKKMDDHDDKFDYIFSKFGFNGKLVTTNYDIVSYIKSIFLEAKNELIIVDPYLDNSIYSFINDIKTNIILITSNKSELSLHRTNVKIINNNSFHDRYIIVDRKKSFLVGTSFNHIGNKTTTIIKIEDRFISDELIELVNSLLKL